MLECYIQCNYNENDAAQLYAERYMERSQPHKSIFRRIKDNLIAEGAFVIKREKKYNKPDKEETTLEVIGAVTINPRISSRQIENEIGVKRSTALHILKSAKFRPYTFRKVPQMQPGDNERRLQFCHWYNNEIVQNALFFKNIIWTDEAYVSSCGIFNRHNEHWWSDVNPHQEVEIQRQGRFGFNVWCAIKDNRVLAYTIFEGTLTSQKYFDILNNFIVEGFLDNISLDQRRNIYFQHDGAPPHKSRMICNLLNINFGEKWIGTNGPIRWPPRSPDLSPLDFFFWGHVKNELYKKPRNNIEELRNNFIECVNSIPHIAFYNTVNSVRKRCELCIGNNGERFENML